MNSDKYSVKSKLRLLLLLMLLASCASLKPRFNATNDTVFTMKTDMYPQLISRAAYYEQMGLGYKSIKQYEKAIESLKLSILHDPSAVSTHLALSDVYIETQHFLLAMIALQDAQKLEPTNLDTMKKIGDLYLETGIYSKARETYEKMLKLNNKDEEAQWALFYIFKLEKKYQEALIHLAKIAQTEQNAAHLAYEKALLYKLGGETLLYQQQLALANKLDPRNRDILIEFAKNSYENKKYKEAAQSLLNYSNTHPFDLRISEHLAFASTRAENYMLAIREYEKQKMASSDTVGLELKIAHCYFLNDDLEDAEKHYLKLAIDEGSDEARYFLGQIYIAKNKFEDASFVLGQVTMLSDYYADAQVKLALYYKSIGNDDKALNTLHEAFVKRPDQVEVYRAYADFLIEHKRYVETVALLERAIQLFPKDEEIRLKMAYLHFRLNNQKAFKKEMLAALKINPQSAEAYAMLSELWYLKNRDLDETMFFVSRATELKSNNKNIKPILAWILMQKDRTTEAVALFEEYYEENPNESFFARSLSQVYSRGGIKEKSKKLADVASKLERDDSLKSRFIFKNETEQVNVEELLENKTRLPASLENQ